MKPNLDTPHTEHLLARASAGDLLAVDELIANHRLYLRKLIDLRMEDELRVRVDPSDVVQETQLVASRRLNDFLDRRPTSFRIWLRRKALEQLVELRRRHLNAARRAVGREVVISDRSTATLARGLNMDTPSQQLIRREQAETVRDAVQKLRDRDREILLLRHVEELTNAEAAEVLQVDATTASHRYGRALRRLREVLLRMGMSRGK